MRASIDHILILVVLVLERHQIITSTITNHMRIFFRLGGLAFQVELIVRKPMICDCSGLSVATSSDGGILSIGVPYTVNTGQPQQRTRAPDIQASKS